MNFVRELFVGPKTKIIRTLSHPQVSRCRRLIRSFEKFQVEVAVDEEEAIAPSQMDEERFKEIEILVAAFDGLEENSSNQSGTEGAEVVPETDQASREPLEVEVPLTTPSRKTVTRVPVEPKSERKVPRAKRTGGAPTRRETAATSEKSEIPNVVGKFTFSFLHCLRPLQLIEERMEFLPVFVHFADGATET